MSELSELRAEVKALHARLECLEQEKTSAAASVQAQGLAAGPGLASGQEHGQGAASVPGPGREPEKISEGASVVEPKVEVEVAAV